MAHEFPALASRATVRLVNHGPELLTMFADRGHAYAAEVLTKDGVELLLGKGVTDIGPGHVTLSDGSSLKTRCVVWGGGLKAAPVAAAPGLPQGKGGRIDVNLDFTVPDFPGVLVIGDIANIPTRTARPTRSSGRWRSRAAAPRRRRSSPTARARRPSRSRTWTRGRWR